jgi:hypothetical protein
MKMNFDGLLSRTASVFPYRGTNKYPIGNRSNTANYAEMVEVGDDIQFNVCHGWQHTTTEISKAKYDLIKNMKGRNVREDTDTGKCEEYTRTTRPLIVVRSDNTIEFVRDRYWQGDNMKLSDWLRGTVYNSYRVSGTAMSNWDSKSNYTHFPVFGGLHIDAETFEPQNQNIQVFRRLIDRKKSKELMGKYRGAFKNVNTMMGCMDTDTLMVSVKDIYDEHADTSNGGQKYLTSQDAFKMGEKLFDEGLFFDAAVLLAIGCDVRGMSSWYISNYKAGQRYNQVSPSTVVPNMLNLLSKSVYKTHKPFHEEEIPFGKITGSEWGLRIMVNGTEVKSQ